MGWNTREEGVREEILDSPLEESMSTTVNYDKYRDCDAAILEGLERLCRANPGREHSTSFSISPSSYPPKAVADLSATRHSENTVCRPCNAEQADPSSPGVKWKVESGPRDRIASC